jgi:protein gp37/ParB-like chromosome segregation protein Spo0J
MKIHEIAQILPEMTPSEFAELKASIKANGLLDPIVLLDGLILDGRHRVKACAQLKIKPEFIDFSGNDPLAFVLDKNVHRRHLDASQRGMIAARIATMDRGRPRSNGQICLINQSEAAGMVNVGVVTVKHARKVLEKGTSELIQAVDGGKITVDAATAIATLPEKDQKTIALEEDESERRKMIREAKDRQKREPKPEPPPKDEPKSKNHYSVQEWEMLGPSERTAIIAEGFEACGQTLNEQTGTSIEWARFSHNTVTGCLHDCPYCYARDFAERYFSQRFTPTFHPARLAGPATVDVPEKALDDESYRNIFANSMSDLFGQWVPEDWISATIEMAKRNPQWNFLTLTKFPQRAAAFEFPDNWWMGTTVDAQCRVSNAEKAFARIRCGTKWLSCEPLLEPLKFSHLDLFQWIVIGGASSSSRTPEWVPDFDWISDLHRAARAAGCRIYYKTNCGMSDGLRIKEFPWADVHKPQLPNAFRYLKGMENDQKEKGRNTAGREEAGR